MQRSASCADQERTARTGLDRMGVDHSDALVLSDEAVSGTDESRPAYQQLLTMIRSKEVAILAVDDQSRLSRGDNVLALVKDLVYCDGRFISVQEGIDTNREGWTMLVGVMEVHNQNCIAETANRVRRGQEGRILDDNGSAGDYPYGYTSEFVDADWQQQLMNGRKPKKRVVIDESHAYIIQIVFHLFANDGWSLARIARFLNDNHISRGNRTQRPWSEKTIGKMLDQKKYVGIWSWGATRTLRNSVGRKRQKPTEPKDQLTVTRPGLAIVSKELWDRVQKRRQEFKDKYGFKKGQKHRGPKHHHTEDYPSNLLSGLMYCHQCGSRLYVQGRDSDTRTYKAMTCPMVAKGLCDMRGRARIDVTSKALLQLAQKLLLAQPDWIGSTMEAMREELDRLTQLTSSSRASREARIKEIEAQIQNMLIAISKGLNKSEDVNGFMSTLHKEKEQLVKELDDIRGYAGDAATMPDQAWILEQFQEMLNELHRTEPQLALALRDLFGKVTVSRLLRPGRKRGGVRLHIRFNRNSAVATVLQQCLSKALIQDLRQASANDEFIEYKLDVLPQSESARWAQHVHEQRQKKVPWKKILEETGLSQRQGNDALKLWKSFIANDGLPLAEHAEVAV